MTEQEAQRLLNEHRAEPVFVRGSHRYTVRHDGLVEVERQVGASGLRWTFDYLAVPDSLALPADVRARARALEAA